MAGTLKHANLALLILFPFSWFAPLLHAGFLPLFGLNEISVVTGLQVLWQTDVFLALVVTIFALLIPYFKVIALALLHFGLLPPRIAPVLTLLGKIAMAEIFLIALFVVVIKGTGVGQVETAWGLYLLAFCILLSLAIPMFGRR